MKTSPSPTNDFPACKGNEATCHGRRRCWPTSSDLYCLPIVLVAVASLYIHPPVKMVVDSLVGHAMAPYQALWSSEHGNFSEAGVASKAGVKTQLTGKVIVHNMCSLHVDIYVDHDDGGSLVGTVGPKTKIRLQAVPLGTHLFYTSRGSAKHLVGKANKRIEHALSNETTKLKIPSSAHTRPCEDLFPACAQEAQRGFCREQPGYMILHCCASCDEELNAAVLLEPKLRCSRNFLNTTASLAWGSGGLHAMFSDMASNPRWSKYNPRILMSPPQGPWVLVLDTFLDAISSIALVKTAENAGFKPSTLTVQGEKTARGFRRSSSAHCNTPDCLQHPSVKSLKLKVQELTNIQWENHELQFVSYKPGEYVGDHMDNLAGSVTDAAGQRILTMLIYLNDVEGGGETTFPRLGISVKPKRGAALLFPNVLDKDPSQMDERFHHEGLPVQQGVKTAVNLWLHQYDFYTSFHWGCQ
mmetsp:Transcript_108847/g.209146  ORF Transcript_108847/g.209146 Transcript_108847/m.209146 type:complete len:470 (+) Transcript_108847:185-1594(+)